MRVKPLSAKWMMGLYDFMKSKPSCFSNGFRELGYHYALNHCYKIGDEYL